MAVISNTTTIIDAGAISVATGAMTLIKTLTASSSANLSFVNGASNVVLDGTYKQYVFKFYNIHPQTDDKNFTVNFRDGATNYDATKTSTYFHVTHAEGSGSTSAAYVTGHDLAQATGGQPVCVNVGNGNATDSCSGSIYMHGCGETDQWKTYIYDTITVTPDEMEGTHGGGNIQQTGAIDRFRMDFSSGNIDAGSFSLYGFSDA